MFPLSCLPLMLHACAAQVLLVSVVFWLFLWWPVQSSSDFHLKALGTFILWKRKKSKCFLHCCWEANRMRHIVKTHSITEAFFPAYELQYFCAVHQASVWNYAQQGNSERWSQAPCLCSAYDTAPKGKLQWPESLRRASQMSSNMKCNGRRWGVKPHPHQLQTSMGGRRHELHSWFLS